MEGFKLTAWHLEGGSLPAHAEDDFFFHDACVHVAEEQDAPQVQVKVEALKRWDKQELVVPFSFWMPSTVSLYIQDYQPNNNALKSTTEVMNGANL